MLVYMFTSKSGNVFFIRCRPATACRVQRAYQLEFEIVLATSEASAIHAMHGTAAAGAPGSARPPATAPVEPRAVA